MAGAYGGWGVVVAVGVIILLAALVLYVYLIVAWVYVFPLIVDRDSAVMPSLGESRSLVHGSGWWWTLLVLFILQLAVGGASFALGMIPLAGSVATILVYPFLLTYVVAMYFQARGEGGLIDAALAAPEARQWTAPPYAPIPPGGASFPSPPAPPPPAPAGSAWQPDSGASQADAEPGPAQPAPPEAPAAPEPPAQGSGV